MTPKTKKKSETPPKKEKSHEETEEPETLEHALAEAKAEVEKYKTKLAYMQAEHENYVKAMKKLEGQLRLQANRDLILRMLPILDDLERAQLMVPHLEENEPFISGLQMVVDNLKGALTDAGVTPIICEGKSFDPLRHEAVVREESTEHAPNIVVAELRKGYLLKGELLRPAMVKITVAPQPAPETPAPTPEEPEQASKKRNDSI
jgi:molecular chaperone GrpE